MKIKQKHPQNAKRYSISTLPFDNLAPSVKQNRQKRKSVRKCNKTQHLHNDVNPLTLKCKFAACVLPQQTHRQSENLSAQSNLFGAMEEVYM